MFAILVGVNKYEDENIRSLNYAVADVKGLHEVLIPQSNAAVSVESESLDESPYKVRGMASNVAEWVADYYKEDYYSSNAGIEWTNPLGPKLSGFIKVKVIRGASWKDINRDTARCARRNRNMPNLKFNNIGFRLAKSE